jgi:hypothetical protein
MNFAELQIEKEKKLNEFEINLKGITEKLSQES